MNNGKIRFAAIAFAAVLSSGAVKLGAQTVAPGPTDAHAVIENMTVRNHSPQSFQAQVQISGHMVSFPFFGGKIDGTCLFKRPNAYQVVFGRSTRYTDAVKRLLVEIASPWQWEANRNITVDPESVSLDGHAVIRLRLTARSTDDKLDYALATVNRATYDLEQMEWHYQDGSSVLVTQTYSTVGQYNVVASQHADLHFPGVRAVADARYTNYETNLALDDRSFAKDK